MINICASMNVLLFIAVWILAGACFAIGNLIVTRVFK